jgi:exonuclease III
MEMNEQLKLNLISVNVRGIHSYAKRMNVFQWLKKMKVDIIFLQETYSTKDNERFWKCQWDGKIFQAHGTNHSKGVAILIKKNVDVDIVTSTIDNEGRYICLNVNIQDQPVCLLNVYAPCSSKCNEQLTFFTNIIDVLKVHHLPYSKIIMGGDCNILMNTRLDRYGGNPIYNAKVMDKVTEIMENNDLIDIWRVRNPYLKQYTWRQRNPLIQSRLDYWFISDSMQDMVKKADIKPAIKTDHSAIVLCLDVN